MSAAAKRLARAPKSPGSLGDLRREFGFKTGASGAHMARTMMLADVTALLAAAPKIARREEFNRLIVEENVLGKRTTSNRWLTAPHLVEFEDFYLVEMKWWEKPLGTGEVSQHLVRVFTRHCRRFGGSKTGH
jgi:hypothetical protein